MLGALFFVVLPRVLERFGSSGGGGFSGAQALQPLIIGLLAMYAARHAGGVSGQLRGAVRARVERVTHLVRREPAPTVEPVGASVNA
jgi:hypothetical protein